MFLVSKLVGQSSVQVSYAKEALFLDLFVYYIETFQEHEIFAWYYLSYAFKLVHLLVVVVLQIFGFCQWSSLRTDQIPCLRHHQ